MKPPEPAGFRLIGERERLTARVFRVVTGTFVDPTGFTFEREVVRHFGAVALVALEGDPPQLHLVRQYRAALDQLFLELPAGKCDVIGEAREATAQRELGEEVGRRAGRLTEVGEFHNSPGFTDERTTIFLAEDLVEIEPVSQGIEEHFMTRETVPLARFWDLVERGAITDAKTIIGVTLAERYLAARSAGEALRPR